MVKFHTSLLAVTLATGSALASSNDFQRRSEGDVNNRVQHLRYGLACAGRLQSRGVVDEEDLFVRDDAFDDLEAREPIRFNTKSATAAFKWGKRLAGHKNTKKALKAAQYGQDIYNTVQSRGLEDDEDLFLRELDAFDDLEAREPIKFNTKSATAAFKWGKRLAKHKNTKKALKAAEYGQDIYNTVQSRGLEDDEDLFLRELDAFDDLEAREPIKFNTKSATAAFKWGKRLAGHKNTKKALKAAEYGQDIYNTVQSRGLEDNEDFFVRDLDAEELFGREYDLLDERDAFDDLD